MKPKFVFDKNAEAPVKIKIRSFIFIFFKFEDILASNCKLWAYTIGWKNSKAPRACNFYSSSNLPVNLGPEVVGDLYTLIGFSVSISIFGTPGK